ncbi:CoA-transferase [Micromonospora sp. NPDC050417]|uniref:CoA-transferase n=1 Tax=Micromonospora sp. NPDC050417 TaxID=3364280 RepID=UPI00378AEF99
MTAHIGLRGRFVPASKRWRSEDLDEMVRAHLNPGDHLHLASTPARPGALIRAVGRCFAGAQPGFVVSSAAMSGIAHVLVLAGVVDRVVTCFAGDTFPTPRPNGLYSRTPWGDPFTLEEWSLLSFTQRLMAAAMGVPYAVTSSLYGSDLVVGKSGLMPIDEGRAMLMPALRPDVTLLHGLCSDTRGNIALRAPYGEGAWGALAARRGVVATVEKVVSDDRFAALRDCVIVPASRVLALTEAPFGAHPQGYQGHSEAGIDGYRDDYAFQAEVTARTGGAESGPAWYAEWVTEPSGHAGYLNRLGAERLDGLRMSTASVPPTRVTRDMSERPATERDRLIVLAARAIAARLTHGRYEVVLAGIGASHLAAWLAADLLRRAGGPDVQVIAELGFVGMHPVSGDPQLFSQDHIAGCDHVAGVPEVLGAMAAGGSGRCLGVLGAAQIDRYGNINSSRTADGSYLIGSGGANDVASTADTLVVATARPNRYVERVPFITSPGRRVAAVVSQFGTFEPASGDRFALKTWLRPDDEDADPEKTIRALTSWPAQLDERFEDEAPISAAELGALRRLTFKHNGAPSPRIAACGGVPS